MKKLFAGILASTMILSTVGASFAAETEILPQNSATLSTSNSKIASLNGSTYVLMDNGKNWENAKIYAETMGGHLATINSKAEDDYLYSYMKSLGHRNAAFGLHKVNNVWTWVTGEAFDYINWAESEPNNMGGSEYVGIYYFLYEEGWNDSTNIVRPYLVEWDDNSTMNTVSHGENEYALLDLGLNWQEAKLFCESMGGHLATVNNEMEDEFLYNLMEDSGYENAHFGLVKDSADQWSWVTGEAFSYENWGEGEPNNQYGSEYVGMYYYKYTDGWNDSTGQVHPFICEWEGNPNYTFSDWAKPQVDNAQADDLIVNGLGMDFTKDITREQIAALLVGTVEKYTGISLGIASVDSFTDTSSTDVLKAVQAGIVVGKGKNLFEPLNTATREEISIMIHQTILVLESFADAELTSKDTSLSGFDDIDQVSSWAKDAVAILANNGMMAGSNNKLNPKGTATIQECIVLNNNLYQLGR